MNRNPLSRWTATNLLAVLLTVPLAALPASGATAASAQGAAATAAPTAPVHPFYAQLLERGVYAYQQGDMEQAADTLRLAVFGLLDHPPRLTFGLAYLALAQRAAGDAETARDTLGRLITVADRFGSYAAAGLPPTVDEQLAALLVAEVPEATLTSSATFRHLGDEKFLRRIADLPTAERRAAIGERATAAPDEPRWPLALARLELAAERPAQAASWAQQALALRPGDVEARCLHGRGLAGAGDCATAEPELSACPASRSDQETALALLACLADLGRWREAQQHLAALPPALRAARPVTRLERRVDREVAQLPAPQTEATVEDDAAALDPSAAAVSDPAGDATAAPVVAELPSAAQADLAEARRLLAAAERQRDLTAPLTLAGGVADAHPESVEAQYLAGEIAYRASRWQEAVRFFRRGGVPQRPDLRFYMAVSLYESGDRPAAAEVLREALPELPTSPFIRSYTERILGTEGGSGGG
jgi:tetratricopeptide (TPR) repeat protein